MARIFDSTTNSYKYLFFQALLDHAAMLDDVRRMCESPRSVSFQELAARMLELAWYPAAFSNLSFGRQDQITDCIRELRSSPEFAGYEFEGATYEDPRQRLRRLLEQRPRITAELGRFVPYRLLSPFFDKELHGLRDQDKNDRICEFADAEFGSGRVPYRLYHRAHGDELLLHPAWIGYLREHGPILQGWVRWHWCQYMLRRNPSTPNVAGRLFRRAERESLGSEKHFWRQVCACMDVRCIYTDRPIEDGDLSLDHFLPWAFVGHDEPWNLVPVAREVNSAKGKRLPHKRFVSHLAHLHGEALVATRSTMNGRAWEKRVEPYRVGLQVPLATDHGYGLSDSALRVEIQEGYIRTVRPLLQLAAGQGFAEGWTPRPPPPSGEP
ncbi:MAG: hypothetical protein HY905_26145 [Deltaproteobacteria bacterium]|nr:hypothetical protein [Deltaproteobacteria bacterium]